MDDNKAYDHRCVVCGSLDTTRWTLDNGSRACVTDLCERDGAPLVAIMDAAGDVPPWKQEKPLRPEDAVKIPIRTRVPRVRGMEPLEWTPPAS